ncbi:hypothetical protein HCEG_04019 [Histoplasma capsulatum var. duboisii H88]|uniref:Uncharacterized protein n=1 Tax=Ajellomyces capsulatus (strain H88) TaxID=544711 RepID=F0UES4_AJEC8|nr:hypothetical protein HCEG_04019 [Histoplasma capsulatum var. duboisii H88]
METDSLYKFRGVGIDGRPEVASGKSKARETYRIQQPRGWQAYVGIARVCELLGYTAPPSPSYQAEEQLAFKQTVYKPGIWVGCPAKQTRGPERKDAAGLGPQRWFFRLRTLLSDSSRPELLILTPRCGNCNDTISSSDFEDLNTNQAA